MEERNPQGFLTT